VRTRAPPPTTRSATSHPEVDRPLRLNPKDLVGFGVVAGTLIALAVHGDDGHQQSHMRTVAADPGQVAAHTAERTGEASIALVGFHLVEGEQTLRDQTVIIHGNRVLEVGPTGSIDLPLHAHAIPAHSNEWIVSPGGSGSGFRPLRPGSVADFLVLSADPRRDPGAVSHPVGFVDGGVWEATERRIARSDDSDGSR